jgi:hypothetical protein
MHIYVLILELNMWFGITDPNFQPNRNPMKFTNEQLREKIVAELGGSRKLSDRSISEMIASQIVFAGEETELDDFFSKAKPLFVTANGNLIKEQADFVRDWNEKHPGQPAPPAQTAPAQGGLTAEDVAKIVAESMKPFAETFGKFQAEKTTEQLFEEAKEKFLTENKPNEENERVKAVLERTFRTIKPTIKTDSDIAAVIAAMKGEFEDLTQIAGITTPYIPVEAGGGSAGAEGTPEYYAKQREELAKEGFIKSTPGATK